MAAAYGRLGSGFPLASTCAVRPGVGPWVLHGPARSRAPRPAAGLLERDWATATSCVVLAAQTLVERPTRALALGRRWRRRGPPGRPGWPRGARPPLGSRASGSAVPCSAPAPQPPFGSPLGAQFPGPPAPGSVAGQPVVMLPDCARSAGAARCPWSSTVDSRRGPTASTLGFGEPGHWRPLR